MSTPQPTQHATVTVAPAHLPGIVHELLLELVDEDDLTGTTTHIAQIALLIEQVACQVGGTVALTGPRPTLTTFFKDAGEHAWERLNWEELDGLERVEQRYRARTASVYSGAQHGSGSALLQLIDGTVA